MRGLVSRGTITRIGVLLAVLVLASPLGAQQPSGAHTHEPNATLDSLRQVHVNDYAFLLALYRSGDARTDSVVNALVRLNARFDSLAAVVDSLRGVQPPPPPPADSVSETGRDSVAIAYRAAWSARAGAADHLLRLRWRDDGSACRTCVPPHPVSSASSPTDGTVPRGTRARDLAILLVAYDSAGRAITPLEGDTLGILPVPARGTQPTPPPPPPTPGGIVQVTEHYFNGPGEDGWSTGGTRNRYVSDPSAPVDPPTVLEMPFGPCSNCGGSAMGNRIVKNFATFGAELWAEFHVRYSPNWEGHPSGVNKIMYLTRSGSMTNPIILAAYGIGQGPLTFQGRQQGQDSSPCGVGRTRNMRPNQGGGRIVRGQWHKVEVYLKLNTRSSGPTCDGIFQVWIDGALTHDYANVHYLDAGTPAAQWLWGRINFAAVWGGGATGTIPAEQTLRMAYLKANVR